MRHSAASGAYRDPFVVDEEPGIGAESDDPDVAEALKIQEAHLAKSRLSGPGPSLERPAHSAAHSPRRSSSSSDRRPPRRHAARSDSDSDAPVYYYNDASSSDEERDAWRTTSLFDGRPMSGGRNKHHQHHHSGTKSRLRKNKGGDIKPLGKAKVRYSTNSMVSAATVTKSALETRLDSVHKHRLGMGRSDLHAPIKDPKFIEDLRGIALWEVLQTLRGGSHAVPVPLLAPWCAPVELRSKDGGGFGGSASAALTYFT